MRVLLIPANDWVQSSVPSRLHHIFGRLSKKDNYEVFVLRYPGLPTNARASLKEVICKYQVHLVSFKSISFKDLSMYYIINFKNLYHSIKKLLKNGEIDVIVHSNILPSAVAVTIGGRYNILTVFDYLDHFPESAASYYHDTAIKKQALYNVVREITKYNIKRSTMVVTVSDYLASMIRKIDPGKKITVLPNGVDLDLFKPLNKEKAAKETALESLVDKKVVIYAGVIGSWINFEMLFRVLRHLVVKKSLDVHLLLLGGSNSSYINKVRQLIKMLDIEKNVTITGFKPHTKVAYYINLADVAIAPYKNVPKNEVTPLKLLEYLACGKPILTTPIGEIVKRFGKYVTVYNDERDLENKLLLALDQNKNQLSLANDIREFLSKNYSWDRISEAYDEILQLTLNSPR